MLVIRSCSCFSSARFFTNGRCGRSVNKKRHIGGMAIMKLYETAAARSVKLVFLTCLMKKVITSYNGTPLKPGNTIFLLRLLINWNTNELYMMRWNLVMQLVNAMNCRYALDVIFPGYPVHPYMLYEISGVRYNFR